MTSTSPGRLSLRPLGLRGPAECEASEDPLQPLAGGPLAFSHCEAIWRAAGESRRSVLPLAAVVSWAEQQAAGQGALATEILERLGRPRGPLGGMDLDQPRIMGIVNVTPDSFSDGGDRFDPDVAVRDGLAMLAAGADILDVGGESTRPGADAVSLEDERARVLPVIEALAAAGACVSVDTRHAAVMQEAVQAGARIINDVTALSGDPESLAAAAEAGVPVVLMHMQGQPQTMQRDPHYDHVALEIYDYLAERLDACAAAGIAAERLVVDPGIGFGKTLTHNLQVLEQIAVFQGLGCPVLLGASRKSFIARLSQGEGPKERLPGSLAAILFALQRGVQILRVHDVAETIQAVAVWQAMTRAPSGFLAADSSPRPLL
ncbi:dihydropteroate synthase [Pelagibius litoralis]|uniref:Dihydropteroate synthase n=1 Tax=Pelagibius litoralis TaxID=374515 RepID=A0A967KDZ7_9PROT|nr:dihydropteroate synthase [Pelagibius litoralis]NIA70485.1 dihydropteroate synthase [Pelagibius litoralis]